MKGEKMSEWEDDEDEENEKDDNRNKMVKSRESSWESGKGRCAVTGRRVLGGTGGVRRVLV